MIEKYTLSEVTIHDNNHERGYSAVLVDVTGKGIPVELSKSNTDSWIAITQKGTIIPLLTYEGRGITSVSDLDSVYVSVVIPKESD